MSDELDLFLITATITPHKIIAGIVLIVVILIVIGFFLYRRGRAGTSS